MVLATSAVANAATDAYVPPADPTSAGRPGTCTLDTERYVQSELDWRSYYLNRLGGPRHNGRLGTDAYPHAPVGSGS